MSLQRRIDRAHAVGKPLVVAELGLPGGTCLSPRRRKARSSDARSPFSARHGTAGALFWSFRPRPAD